MKKHTQYLRAEHEAAKQQTTGADSTGAKPTPGPWCLDSAGQGDVTVTSTHDTDGSDDDVCEVYGADEDQQLANATLIAAAPDLLAALEDVLRYCVTPKGFPDAKHRTIEQQAAYDNARAAINKAKTL